MDPRILQELDWILFMMRMNAVVLKCVVPSLWAEEEGLEMSVERERNV